MWMIFELLLATMLATSDSTYPAALLGIVGNPFKILRCISVFFTFTVSAARFGHLSPFGRLIDPFGDQFFDLAIFKFGSFWGYFSKKTV